MKDETLYKAFLIIYAHNTHALFRTENAAHCVSHKNNANSVIKVFSISRDRTLITTNETVSYLPLLYSSGVRGGGLIIKLYCDGP